MAQRSELTCPRTQLVSGEPRVKNLGLCWAWWCMILPTQEAETGELQV